MEAHPPPREAEGLGALVLTSDCPWIWCSEGLCLEACSAPALGRAGIMRRFPAPSLVNFCTHTERGRCAQQEQDLSHP